MLLVMDVGNTNIVMGVYRGKELVAHWRMATNISKTSDETGMFIVNLFHLNKLDIDEINDVIIASVVPPVMYSLEHAVRKYIKLEPILLEPGIKTGINIKYENPREVGADRIANAVGGCEIYGGPLIIVDFGTATTFCAVSAKHEYLGGLICPGIKISADALFQNCAKLPRIEIEKPGSVIGKNTVHSMKSGIVYGYVGQVDYIVKRMKVEMNEKKYTVVATGGLARFIAEESETIDEVNGLLSLEGLRIIYEKNKV